MSLCVLCVLCGGAAHADRELMTFRAVTIVNRLGMHARAAAKFVHLASRFDSRIRVARDGREMDGKSVMGLLLLAAAQGSAITISADGFDEIEAVTTLAALVQRGFEEDEATRLAIDRGQG